MFANRRKQSGGRAVAPVAVLLALALCAVYAGFQHGEPTLGPAGSIEFRCHAVEHGLIPYELTHPGTQISDPYCQPQPEDVHPGEAGDHPHPHTDPGLSADAPAWLTVATSTVMHGGLLQLGVSVLFLLLAGRPLERRIGSLRLLALFVTSGLASAAALVALAPALPIATMGSTGAIAGIVGAALLCARLALPVPALLAGWVLLLVAVARLDSAQPVAGAGGDVAYLAPVAGLALGLLAGRRWR